VYLPRNGLTPWCTEPGTWSQRNLWIGALMLDRGGSFES